MNKEQKIWLSASFISGIISVSMVTMAIGYDIRFRYGLYIAISAYVMTFISIIMYALVQYASTREVLSILVRKVYEF